MRFRALAALAAKGDLVPHEYEPAPLGPHDVEIAISHCGLCHSDLHLIDDSWARSRYPLVPGHEIAGTVVAAGPLVVGLRPGARVGVGWQRGACLACDLCLRGEENLCLEQQATCLGHPGGLADRIRVDGRFVFPLPDGLDGAAAAPLLCGGITVYAPLRRLGVGAISRVGVIGVGGLGHIAIKMLRALGAETVAFSSSPDKREAALAMGAHEVVSSTDAKAVLAQAGRLDLVLSTVHARLDWTSYLRALRPNGVLCLLGLPPGLIQIPPALLVTGQRAIMGSDIGGRAAIREMLAFAARHRVTPDVEVAPLAAANAAVARLRGNQARYRIVLTNQA